MGNRVTSITDASDNGSGYEGGGQKISYDANGNMTDMPDKGIASISYNHLNLPVQMEIGESNSKTTIKNLYRSDGTKLKKENTTTTIGIAGSTSTKNETDYLDGFQYLSKTGSGDPGSTESLETDVAMEREAFTRKPNQFPEAARRKTLYFSFFQLRKDFTILKILSIFTSTKTTWAM
ncbi:hypothetical protein LDL59_05300 [Kaistella anthropi]|nr:hypothetical protein [Kaistella anthropi]